MTGNTRRLALLHRGNREDMLVKLPSKAFISTDKFEEMLMDLGNFSAMEGFGKSHLKRIFRAIGEKFRYAYELKYLGWQREGFWSYSNAAYHNGQLTEYNDYGMAEIGKQHYYSPSASSLFKDTRKDEEGKEINEDNPYTNDKSLRLLKTSVSFETYSQHMVKMHKENAMPLVCYAFVSLFKDVITAYEKCPILYGYGLVKVVRVLGLNVSITGSMRILVSLLTLIKVLSMLFLIGWNGLEMFPSFLMNLMRTK